MSSRYDAKMSNRYYGSGMSKTPAPSDLADKFMLRMPSGMRDRIARAAKASGRSMNAEIVQTLEDHYPPETELRDLMHWIEEVVWHANTHNWRDNRKILVEALRMLREKINDETFDPAEMARPSSYHEKLQEHQRTRVREHIPDFYPANSKLPPDSKRDQDDNNANRAPRSRKPDP